MGFGELRGLTKAFAELKGLGKAFAELKGHSKAFALALKNDQPCTEVPKFTTQFQF